MTDIASLIKKGKPQPPTKFIIMGEPMSGKTTLAAKAPRPLFISTDGNAAKAGLDAVEATDLGVVRAAFEFFATSKEYDTLVIDTIEGIADLFEQHLIASYNASVGPEKQISALADVEWGKLTSAFKKRMADFSESLWSLDKNVLILTYTKRRLDETTGSLILDSELKDIRHFTKFADGIILTSYDGEKYRAQVVSKRTVMAGEVQYGTIEPFLRAAGWTLPTKKVKMGQARK
jgi:hypothetical protein